MTVASEMALVGILGACLLLAAVIVFNRQE
jgi:hypothetical protein